MIIFHQHHNQLLLFLCIFVSVLLFSTCNSKSFTPEVTYVSYSKRFAEKIQYYPTRSIILNSVLKADDSPFERIDLPWGFNFFGRTLFHMYVSPNGALHDSSKQPCQCGCFYEGAKGCNYDSSYMGLIAGFLTDLNPSASKPYGGNITFNVYPSFIRIYYQNITIFGKLITNSFSIIIHSDSRVEIEYIHVNTSATSFELLMSGLRVPSNTSLSHTYFTSQQLSLGQTDWSTTVKGIYPPRSYVKSGNSFITCPISRTWCSNTNQISTHDNISTIIALTPISLSCSDELEFSISITRISTNVYTSNNKLHSCNVIFNLTLSCNISSFISTLNTSSIGSWQINIFWKPLSSKILNNFEFSQLPIANHIPLTIATDLNYFNNVSQCSVNTPFPGCNNCSICNQELSCLQLPCDGNAYSKNPYAYKYPTCLSQNNSCQTNLVLNSSPSYTCCTIDDQDCNGNCFGSAKVGLTSTSTSTSASNVCCLSSLDCFNICGGSALRDACGICGGNDFKGYHCKLPYAIQTGHTDGNIYPTIDLSTAKASNYSKYSYINISNTNSSQSINLQFFLSTKCKSQYDPVISYPTNSYTIPINSWKQFQITTSLNRLLNNKISTWETKTLFISINDQQLNSSNSLMQYAVEIYPAISQCSFATSELSCMRLPGCIFCSKYKGDRQLTAEYSNSSGFMEDNFVEEKLSARNLFADILPIGIDPDFDIDKLPGICRDGWRVENCSGLFSASSRSGCSLSKMDVMLMGISSIMIFTSWLFYS